MGNEEMGSLAVNLLILLRHLNVFYLSDCQIHSGIREYFKHQTILLSEVTHCEQ